MRRSSLRRDDQPAMPSRLGMPQVTVNLCCQLEVSNMLNEAH